MVGGATVALVVVVVLFLMFGGQEGPTEKAGDLAYIEGVVPKRQRQVQLASTIADINTAEINRADTDVVFAAQVVAPIPRRLETSVLELRWDLAPPAGARWTLTVKIDRRPEASLFSEEGFGAGTVDDTFPGEIVIEGSVVEVRLDPEQIENFPSGFEWTLSTTLRAFRDATDSPRVEDRFPNQGSERFEM